MSARNFQMMKQLLWRWPLLNAELENGDGTARDLTKWWWRKSRPLIGSLEISFRRGRYLPWSALWTHLKFFFVRVLTDNDTVTWRTTRCLTYLNVSTPWLMRQLGRLAGIFKQTRNYQTSGDEQLYLTIHLSRMKRRTPCEANTKNDCWRDLQTARRRFKKN